MLDTSKIKQMRGTYSQAELARRCGMSVQQWHGIESGAKKNPRVSTVERMAHALRCRVDDLLTWNPQREVTP